VLALDGRLLAFLAFLAWATLGSLLVLGADALVRQQVARPATAGRRCRSATGWPTTWPSRSPRWWPWPNGTP
jgi:hypothetical protein